MSKLYWKIKIQILFQFLGNIWKNLPQFKYFHKKKPTQKINDKINLGWLVLSPILVSRETHYQKISCKILHYQKVSSSETEKFRAMKGEKSYHIWLEI
jgi:hypothetical protein